MADLTIKNVPEAVIQKLRERAASNQRSLQAELMALITAAVGEPETSAQPDRVETGWKSVEQVFADRRREHAQPIMKGPFAVDIIRAERDAR